jgi:type IV secretory pathway protease TraF
MTPTSPADVQEAVRAACDAIPDVNGQVILAAAEMTALQKAAPEWMWHGQGQTSFGRWQYAEGQAPYVRGDLVLAAIATARAAGAKEERARIFAIAYPTPDKFKLSMTDRVIDAGDRLDQIVELTKPDVAIRSRSNPAGEDGGGRPLPTAPGDAP